MRVLIRFFLAAAVSLLPPLAQGAPAPLAPDRINCAPQGEKIDEQGFVAIGGIEQWVTIKGDDCRNPVVLFVHGGPGNPNGPFADRVYAGWQQDFTLVQWDQRGAGMTYGRNRPDADTPLTIERMAQDGTELAAYLARHLDQRKVILFGGSWGSALGVQMAKAQPQLFHAYVGTGQMVEYRENQSATYRRLLELARAANDVKTVATIEALGPPPWANPRNFGIVRRATRIYEAKTTTPPPKDWWQPAPLYATPQALADYEAGEDYSFLQFVGMNGDGMLSRIDTPALGLVFGLPVFLLQGSEDLVTMPDVAKRYFDRISAPRKEFIMIAATGHDPNGPMIAAQYDVLKRRVRPLVTMPPVKP